jgi:hypothetical protein
VVDRTFSSVAAVYITRMRSVYGFLSSAKPRPLRLPSYRIPAKEPTKLGRTEEAVEKRIYNAASLERSLRAFESRFGMDSETFLAAHEAESEAVVAIPRFVRHTWASFYVDWKRLSGDDFGARVAHDLELV